MAHHTVLCGWRAAARAVPEPRPGTRGAGPSVSSAALPWGKGSQRGGWSWFKRCLKLACSGFQRGQLNHTTKTTHVNTSRFFFPSWFCLKIGWQKRFWIITRKTFMAGLVSRQMKSHFWSAGLLTEFPWIIVNALCSAATGEAGLVWLQQMHLYQGFNYPDSWIGF